MIVIPPYFLYSPIRRPSDDVNLTAADVAAIDAGLRMGSYLILAFVLSAVVFFLGFMPYSSWVSPYQAYPITLERVTAHMVERAREQKVTSIEVQPWGFSDSQVSPSVKVNGRPEYIDAYAFGDRDSLFRMEITPTGMNLLVYHKPATAGDLRNLNLAIFHVLNRTVDVLESRAAKAKPLVKG